MTKHKDSKHSKLPLSKKSMKKVTKASKGKSKFQVGKFGTSGIRG